MFKSIGGFFRDVFAPVALSFLPGGPFLAAAYSGIKTGIQTGSPLAGLGSAGLSFGLSSAFRGITDAAAKPATALPVFQETGTKLGAEALTEGTGSALRSSFVQPAFGGAAAREITKTGIGTIPAATTTGFTDRISNIGNIFDADKLQAGFIDTTIKEQIPGGITDALPDFITERSPLTLAGAGLGLQMAATPPPEPAPFGPIQSRRTTDLSKYGYKGPLDRGEYTYADPEDIAYGRVTPGSYGYLGAKEGGKIKAQGGGVMMQSGPYNPQIEAQKGTFRPTGSMVAPTAGPGISRIAQTQPMMSVSPQKIAGLAQPVAPTIPTTNVPMAQPQTPAPMPMPIPQQQKGGIEEQAQQLINDLPQKDININIDQIRQFIGLAEGGEVPTTEKEFARLGIYKRPEDYDTKNMNVGGEVPGMAKPASAGITGPSSNIGPNVSSNINSSSPEILNEEDFVAEFMRVMPGSFGKIGSYLDNPQIGRTIYQQYKNYAQPKKEMAEGGEVESDQMLQENAFVIPADVVGHIGDGSSDAGAQRLQSYLGMDPQQYQAGGIMAGELQGPGGGMDDLIQTSIEGKRAAAVSPQEFVVPRDIVAELGQGSYDKGSNKLYALMRNVRKTKTGTTKQPAELTRGLGQLMRTAVA